MHRSAGSSHREEVGCRDCQRLAWQLEVGSGRQLRYEMAMSPFKIKGFLCKGNHDLLRRVEKGCELSKEKQTYCTHCSTRLAAMSCHGACLEPAN